MRYVRVLILLIFVASLITLVAFPSTGDTSTETSGGKYYTLYRSTRTEATREEYAHARARIRAAGITSATLMISLFGFIGLETVIFTNRRLGKVRTHRA